VSQGACSQAARIGDPCMMCPKHGPQPDLARYKRAMDADVMCLLHKHPLDCSWRVGCRFCAVHVDSLLWQGRRRAQAVEIFTYGFPAPKQCERYATKSRSIGIVHECPTSWSRADGLSSLLYPTDGIRREVQLMQPAEHSTLPAGSHPCQHSLNVPAPITTCLGTAIPPVRGDVVVCAHVKKRSWKARIRH
jgi:hypothetical protein